MIDPNAPIVPYTHRNLNVNLNLKAMCNLRCDYCSIPEVSKSTNVQDATIINNMKLLLEKMIAEGYTWSFVMLIGAEPLMVKPETIGILFNMVLTAFPVCRIKIQSNGTLFTDDYASRLQKTMNEPERLLMGWSLDGVRDIHNEWRDNSYDLAVKNLFSTNAKFVFKHQIVMSVGPQHFEPGYREELLEFTMKCVNSGIHPTFSVVDYSINEKAKNKQSEIMRVDNVKVWKPLADFLIEYDIINLCEKYFGDGYCRRQGNECSRVLFDLSDGGVYQCEKTFDIDAATINNYLYSSIEECMLSRKGCTQNCAIDPECFKCEYWDWCQGSCSLKRTDGIAHACELTKHILGHIKHTLGLDYFEFLKNAHNSGVAYIEERRIEMKNGENK